jgi:hypothetical protein
MIKTIGGTGRVVEVRDEYMPVIDLEKVFDVPRFDFENVVEHHGRRRGRRRPRRPAGRRAARPAAGRGEEPRSQLPQGAGRVGRHHHGRRPRGPDPGRGRLGGGTAAIDQPMRHSRR